ncbi:MAG: hypothetical protein AB1637_07660, partial [Elusimicrobiota bacterium]
PKLAAGFRILTKSQAIGFSGLFLKEALAEDGIRLQIKFSHRNFFRRPPLARYESPSSLRAFES